MLMYTVDLYRRLWVLSSVRYEAKFKAMLVKENYSAAKKFNYTRRFIDDLHTLNNDGRLEENNNKGRIHRQFVCADIFNRFIEIFNYWMI